MRQLIIILIAFFLLLFSSCENTCSFGSKTRILTGRKWEINSYIDYSINREISVATEVYEFSADGTVFKVKNNDTIYCTWEMPECNYLKVDLKTFRIVDLSRKVMVLRYGELDFVYRSQR